MKILKHVLLLYVLVEIVAYPAEPIDPDKSLYQLDWGTMPPFNCWIGGGWSERQHPQKEMSVEDKEKLIKFENMQAAAVKGRSLISTGIAAITLGAILVFALKQFHLQWVGLIACGYGIWSFSRGILEIKMAENWEVATGAALVAVIILVVSAILWSSGVDLGAIKKRISSKLKQQTRKDTGK